MALSGIQVYITQAERILNESVGEYSMLELREIYPCVTRKKSHSILLSSFWIDNFYYNLGCGYLNIGRIRYFNQN